MTRKRIWELKIGERVALPVYDINNIKIFNGGVLTESIMRKLLNFNIRIVWIYPTRRYVN